MGGKSSSGRSSSFTVPPPSNEGLFGEEIYEDSNATKENEEIANLPEGATEEKKNRDVWIQKTLKFCIPFTIIFGFVVLWVVVGIYMYHLLTPDTWHFLTKVKLDVLHKMLFSSFAGAAITAGARKYLE